LIIALVSWRFTRPIQELSNAARRASSGDFDFSVPAMQRDEMGSLARAFNEMLAGLRSKRELEEKLQRAERSALTGRIAAGIAHEIRNPLSFINLTIDFMRDKFAPAADTVILPREPATEGPQAVPLQQPTSQRALENSRQNTR
jgi:nitrogen fixation/metabolism regulation signal transduction histidine kinase